MTIHRFCPYTARPTPALPLAPPRRSAVAGAALLRKCGVITLAAALLSGCAPTHLTLHPENSGQDGTGIVRQNFLEPYQIEVTVAGQVYTGEWRSQEAPDHPLAQSYLHKRGVGRVVTTLTNGEGKRMTCNWLVEGLRGYGTCEDDSHRKFAVTIG
ncbi:MAG: hypothetical protein NT159_22090 [Proteobacteria bacterium]|nr:hypothetical protein [Pseudomonadota bacterium]